VQLTVVVAAALLVWRHTAEGAGSTSAEAFCPFGGFESAWTWVTTGRTVAHVHPANLVLAGVLVVLALAARGMFCGWVCPLGSLQEAVHAAAAAVVRRLPGLRRAQRHAAARPWVRRLDRVLRYGRYVVLLWAVGGVVVTGAMVFRGVDPWVALLTLTEFELSTAFAVLVAVLLLALVVDRPFCRYACPLGALQGLVGTVSPLAVQRTASSCLGCDLCNRACPMGISVNRSTRVTDPACIGCLECVAACPSRDALALTVSLPRRPVVDDLVTVRDLEGARS
jgi:polyferredoxin